MSSSTFRTDRPPTHLEKEGGELWRSSTRMMLVNAVKSPRRHVIQILERCPVSALSDIGQHSPVREATYLEFAAMARP
jgi:hypothetical protein